MVHFQPKYTLGHPENYLFNSEKRSPDINPGIVLLQFRGAMVAIHSSICKTNVNMVGLKSAGDICEVCSRHTGLAWSSWRCVWDMSIHKDAVHCERVFTERQC